MLALINLEYRRLIPMLPYIGLLLVIGLIPGLMDPKGGIVGLSFVSIAAMLLITRAFPMGPAEDRANTLAATLPTRRRQVISARYTLVTGLVTLLAAVVIIITALQPGESFGSDSVWPRCSSSHHSSTWSSPGHCPAEGASAPSAPPSP